MPVPEIDQQIGIEAYLTKTDGIGGVIRREVEDFAVREILVDGSKATTLKLASKPALGASGEKQPFLLCVLVKRNWDTLVAIKNVARQLRVDQSKISIAGIKDAKALTAQHLTIEGLTCEDVQAFSFKDMELRPLGYFREPLSSFYLLGNNFSIAIRQPNVDSEDLKESIEKVSGELAAKGGIANFYGHQRFGTTRAITHRIGKALVQGDLEEAAMVLLAEPSAHEHPASRQARAELQATGDFKQALRDFPVQLRFERQMLVRLAEDATDFLGAFRLLPLKLRKLFVQAWQSFLFNRFLSARIQQGFAIGCVEVGDFVVNVEHSGLPMVQTGRLVSSAEVAEVNRSIVAGKMRVALPIFGFKQKLSGGEIGRLQRRVLEEEEVESNGFRVPLMPEVAARGELRAAVCPVRDFVAKVLRSGEDSQVRLDFTLFRGSYATVLLREIMKQDDPISAGF